MRTYLARLLLLFSSILPVSAQGGPFSDSVQIPDKPVARFIKPLINVVNEGDPKKVEAFVMGNFTPGYRDMFPMEAHLHFFMNTHSRYSKLKFHAIRNYEEPQDNNALVFIVWSERMESWRGFWIKAQAEAPHLISSIDFTPARTPNNITQPGPLTENQAVAELGAFVDRMTAKDVFSGTVLFAHKDRVLYQTAKGRASKRFDVPNNLDTKFNLGSMNKMFTSLAVMQLVQAGKLKLTDPLSAFADESWLPKEMTDKIQVQHLLTHSSGLGSYFNEIYMESSKTRFRALDDYKLLVKDSTLHFEPGTSNRYSNTGMLMLGVVIEKASGLNYFDYIRKNITEPAGMVHTECYEMDQPVPNLAIGYSHSDNPTGFTNNFFKHVIKGGPAGGGFSTVKDLHRFALALSNNKLLSLEFRDQMLSPRPELHSPHYGYGFSTTGEPGDRVVGHSGGFSGISSNMDLFLDQGYVAIVMSNYSGGSQPISAKMRELTARINPGAVNN